MPDHTSDETKFRLSSRLYGHGDKVIIAFHGFGQESSRYSVYEEWLGDRYTIHSFDLPFHGENQDRTFLPAITPDMLKDWFGDYLHSNDIRFFTTIGFSIGAKFALNLAHLFPDKTNRIILIAPDGLKINFWYHLATGNMVTRKIFKYVVDHPGFFFRFTDLMSTLKIIHPSVNRFAKSQMGEKQQRDKVYETWTKFRKMNIDIRKLGRIIRTHQISVEVILGEKDRIIRYKDLKPLLAHLPDAKVISIPSGHHKLIEESAEYYRENGF